MPPDARWNFIFSLASKIEDVVKKLIMDVVVNSQKN